MSNYKHVYSICHNNRDLTPEQLVELRDKMVLSLMTGFSFKDITDISSKNDIEIEKNIELNYIEKIYQLADIALKVRGH